MFRKEPTRWEFTEASHILLLKPIAFFYLFKIAHVSNWVIVIPSHLNKYLLSLCLPNNILLWRIFKHVFLWQHWVSIVARRNPSFPMWDLVTCSCLDTQSCLTLCDPMDCNKSGFLVLHHLQGFVQTHVHWVSDVTNHLILCFPFLLLPTIFLSIKFFPNESALRIRWPKYWSFSIGPSDKYSSLIPFRIDWFDLLPVQELSRIFSSTTIWKYPFFGAQHSLWSNSHMTAGKTTGLTIWTFFSKVMSLLF